MTADSPLVAQLKAARRIMVFTGAGVSTASGIPDFRGPHGVWTRRQPVYFDQFLASEAARIDYWDYKLETWEIYSHALPNAVHHAIVALEGAGKIIAVVTQNVDGLHVAAGTSLNLLVELHGTDRLVKCLRCEATSEPGPHFEAFKATRCPPRCSCGGPLKPATISFGQSLCAADLERAADAAAHADLVLALGSTLSVFPAASFPLIAAERGVPYIIINDGETGHDGQACVTVRLHGDVTAIVPPAVEAALALRQGS
jgi:NAD-dependent deacetylase